MGLSGRYSHAGRSLWRNRFRKAFAVTLKVLDRVPGSHRTAVWRGTTGIAQATTTRYAQQPEKNSARDLIRPQFVRRRHSGEVEKVRAMHGHEHIDSSPRTSVGSSTAR